MRIDKGIDYFRRGHWLTSIQEKVSLRARRKMYDIWLQFNAPHGSTILDVGTTPDLERLDSNCFLKWLLDARFIVSAVSPEDLGDLNKKYSQIQILPKLPFDSTKPWKIDTNSFDWVFSSAVLEHVGDNNRQVHFLRECARISGQMFITTPNRWHWLEFHTKLPFIHWLPPYFHRKLLRVLGLDFWSLTENLNLVSFSQLEILAIEALGKDFIFEIKTVRTLGRASNLILIGRRISPLPIGGEKEDQ